MSKETIVTRDISTQVNHVLLNAKNAFTVQERQSAARQIMMTYACLGMESPSDYTIPLAQSLMEAMTSLVK